MTILGEPLSIETRAGAVLSARNREDLQKAVDLIQSVLGRAAMPDEPMPEDEEDMTEDENETMMSAHLLDLTRLLATKIL